MEQKIKKATSYYLKYRQYAYDDAFMKEAANYFATSHDEYIIILEHLKRVDRTGVAVVPCNEQVMVVPPGCHYWGGKIRNNAEWRRRW